MSTETVMKNIGGAPGRFAADLFRYVSLAVIYQSSGCVNSIIDKV